MAYRQQTKDQFVWTHVTFARFIRALYFDCEETLDAFYRFREFCDLTSLDTCVYTRSRATTQELTEQTSILVFDGGCQAKHYIL